jgi:hypothetical protein
MLKSESYLGEEGFSLMRDGRYTTNFAYCQMALVLDKLVPRPHIERKSKNNSISSNEVRK